MVALCNHEMLEAQVLMHVDGSIGNPTSLVAARAGFARLRLGRDGYRQSAETRSVPPSLLETAEHLRSDALTKLASLPDHDAVLSLRALVREREVHGTRSGRHAFAGFWGSLKPKDGWPLVFGSDPDGNLAFREGAWTAWPQNLPTFEHLNPHLPMILSPYCATLFHEAVGHALEDDYIQGSPLKFYHGEKVSHKLLTILDRPDLPGYAGSMSHDDAGEPVSATTLLQQGFLVGDLAHNKGAWRRGSFRDLPLVRATNFLIRPGEEDPRAWLKGSPSCYYVGWVQSGNWRAGSEQFKVLTGPVFLLHHGEPVAVRPWLRIKFTIGRFLRAIAAIGQDQVMDPVVHWCLKQNQSVPLSMGSPSLLLEGWA